MYGKLEFGALSCAPKAFDGIPFPSHEEYLERGYFPVVFSSVPIAPDGYYSESDWEQQKEAIVQTWSFVELSDNISDADALGIILGGAV